MSIDISNPAKRAKVEKQSTSMENQIGSHEELDHVSCTPGQMFGSFRVEKPLGEGTFGRVLLATDISTNTSVALKIIKNDSDKRGIALSEIAILRMISRKDSENKSLCVNMLDYFMNESFVCIVFPVLGQSVFDYMQENDFKPFPLEQVYEISLQLCKAVEFLHSYGMVHTDLKPENILFVDSGYTTVYDPVKNYIVRRINRTDIKLIDFGMLTRERDPHRDLITTRSYRAPEVILQLGWSHPCDVWSIGCILFEIYYGSLLFYTEEDREHLALMEMALGSFPVSMINATVTDHFKNGQVDWIPNGCNGSVNEPLKAYMLNSTVDDELLFDLIEKMCRYEPDKRIPIGDALEHPFFKGTQVSECE